MKPLVLILAKGSIFLANIIPDVVIKIQVLKNHQNFTGRKTTVDAAMFELAYRPLSRKNNRANGGYSNRQRRNVGHIYYKHSPAPPLTIQNVVFGVGSSSCGNRR